MDPQVGDASGFLVFTSSHNLDSPKCTQFENRNIYGPKVDLEDSHSDRCVGCTKLQLNLKTESNLTTTILPSILNGPQKKNLKYKQQTWFLGPKLRIA